MACTSGWQGSLLNSDAAQKDLYKRSGARYLRDQESVCTCVCIASLLVGFGVKGLLQPGSTGLGCEETLGSEMHQSQAGRRNLLGTENQQIWLPLAWMSGCGP